MGLQASHSLLDCALLLAFAILIGIVATAGRITKDQIQYTQVLFTWDCQCLNEHEHEYDQSAFDPRCKIHIHIYSKCNVVVEDH